MLLYNQMSFAGNDRGPLIGLNESSIILNTWHLGSQGAYDWSDPTDESLARVAKRYANFDVIFLEIHESTLANQRPDLSDLELKVELDNLVRLYYTAFRKYAPWSRIIRYNFPSTTHITEPNGQKIIDGVSVSLYPNENTDVSTYLIQVLTRLSNCEAGAPVYLVTSPAYRGGDGNPPGRVMPFKDFINMVDGLIQLNLPLDGIVFWYRPPLNKRKPASEFETHLGYLQELQYKFRQWRV